MEDVKLSEKKIRLINEKVRNFPSQYLDYLIQYIDILEKGVTNYKPEGKFLKGFLNISHEQKETGVLHSFLPIRWEMYNAFDVVHGGILATLMDVSMGEAISYQHPFEIENKVTLSINIYYIKPVQSDKLTAESRLIQAGKTISLVECYIKNERDEIVSKGVGTFRVWLKK